MKAGLRRIDDSKQRLLIEIKHRKIDDGSRKPHGSELDEAMSEDPLHKGKFPYSI
jgi:hypothetical protein